MKSERSTKKTETKEISCGICAFFGKPFLCVRKERNPKAETCLSYKRKASPQDKALYPLLPDIGLGKIKEADAEFSKPSDLWYLVPLLFGILGGIVAYVGVKDDDKEMATLLLIFGIFWTLILFVVFAAFLFPINYAP